MPHKFNGFVTLTQLNQNSRRYPRSSSHNFSPRHICFGARLTESLARDQMTLQIEVIVDGIVNRQTEIAELIRVIPSAEITDLSVPNLSFRLM